MIKLYLVHCGYYDGSILDGVYESHANFLVPARDESDAKAIAKTKPEYVKHRMHIDGIHELSSAGEYRVVLEPA